MIGTQASGLLSSTSTTAGYVRSYYTAGKTPYLTFTTRASEQIPFQMGVPYFCTYGQFGSPRMVLTLQSVSFFVQMIEPTLADGPLTWVGDTSISQYCNPQTRYASGYERVTTDQLTTNSFYCVLGGDSKGLIRALKDLTPGFTEKARLNIVPSLQFFSEELRTSTVFHSVSFKQIPFVAFP